MSSNKTGISFLDKKIERSEHQLSLPFWSDVNRAMPNHIARSSLFTPLKKGPRPFLDDNLLYSRKDVEITYTGYALDESDADLWMQLLHCFRETSNNESIYFVKSQLIKSLKKRKGSSAYKWLDESLTRLQRGAIKIESDKYTLSTHMIPKYAFDKVKNTYYLQIDSDIAKLFSNNEFSLLDWEQRLSLEYDLAKSLHCQISASSNKKQKYEFSDLMKRFKRNEKNLKYLKRDLKKACYELQEKNVLIRFELNENLTVWKRPNLK